MERHVEREVSSSGFQDKALNKSEDIMIEDQSIIAANIVKNEYQVLLSASLSAARFLLKCAIPFRGLDDSEMLLETIQVILPFNETLRKVTMENSELSNQMVAPSIQKDIVSSFAQEVLKRILEEIGDDVFALIVDEYRDVSEEKQMGVILRYVTCGIIKEKFVGVIHVSETSAEFLKSSIQSLFVEYGLSLKKVRGQGYDGSSNMCDDFHGLKTLIMGEYSSAYYVHSFAYQFKLVVVAVADKHLDVAYFFNNITILMHVVCAPCVNKDVDRENLKEKVEEAIGVDEREAGNGWNGEFSLERARDTCGGSFYETLLHLVDSFSTVVDVLEYIEKEGRIPLSRYQACRLLDYFDTFNFVFYLHLMLHILGLTDSLSEALQRKDQDLLNVISLAKSTKQELQKFRVDGFDLLLKKISSFCEKHDFEMLDLEKDYVNPSNRRQPTNITWRHHYEFDCFNAAMDLQIQEIDDRFSEISSELFICMAALNPRDSFCDFDQSKLMNLVELYPDDFSLEEKMTLEYELEIYINNMRHDERFANLNGISDLAKTMVETRKHLTFPLVYRLLKLALVLPIATPTTERCFSTKEIVKSYLRDQICNDFVKTCLVPIVETEELVKVTEEDVINRLQKMESHRTFVKGYLEHNVSTATMV